MIPLAGPEPTVGATASAALSADATVMATPPRRATARSKRRNGGVGSQGMVMSFCPMWALYILYTNEYTKYIER
jgi:hypothetical protein